MEEKVSEKLSEKPSEKQGQQGKVGWAVLWLLGIPLPVLFVLFLARGCT